MASVIDKVIAPGHQAQLLYAAIPEHHQFSLWHARPLHLIALMIIGRVVMLVWSLHWEERRERKDRYTQRRWWEL
jgi:hypothetical protein